MKSRDYIHISDLGVSLGVDNGNDVARIAVAVSNTNDNFTRKGGREILNMRFDDRDARLQALGLKRNVLALNYNGTKPRHDILFPVADALREAFGFKFNSDLKRFVPPKILRHRRSADRVLKTVGAIVELLPFTNKEITLNKSETLSVS